LFDSFDWLMIHPRDKGYNLKEGRARVCSLATLGVQGTIYVCPHEYSNDCCILVVPWFNDWFTRDSFLGNTHDSKRESGNVSLIIIYSWWTRAMLAFILFLLARLYALVARERERERQHLVSTRSTTAYMY
jgi:hypothetical protein